MRARQTQRRRPDERREEKVEKVQPHADVLVVRAAADAQRLARHGAVARRDAARRQRLVVL